MRKLLPLAVTALALTACHPSPEAAAIDGNAAMIEASLQRQADEMEAMANNVADQQDAEAIANAADDLQEVKDNIADAAGVAKKNLR